MPARKTMKSASKARKGYPKRKTVRSTVMQRARTMEYAADPVPPSFPLSTSIKEQKYLDASLTMTLDCLPSPDATNIQHLNQISQGTTVNQRLGMRYAMTGLHIRGTLNQAGAQSVIPVKAGYWIVYDSEPHGAKATAQEMFNLKYNDMHYAFPNGSEGQKGGRFKYLYRKEYLLGNQGSGTNQIEMDGSLPGCRLINDYIPLNKLVCQHNRLDTFGTISHIQKGALLIIPFGQTHSTVTGDPATPPAMLVTYRMYFTE